MSDELNPIVKEEEIITGSPLYQKKYYQEKYKNYHKQRYEENKEIVKEMNRKKYQSKALDKLHRQLDEINNTIQTLDINNIDINLLEQLNKKLKIEQKIYKLLKKSIE